MPQRLTIEPPPRGAGLSLRATLFLVVLAAGVYAGALPVYLYIRVRTPALALGAGTAAIVARQLDEARALARDLLEARRPPGADTLAAIDRLVARGRAPPGAPPDTAGPLALRAALARADGAMRLVADTVAVAVAALARGAQAQAAAGLRAAARLDRAADREGFEAGELLAGVAHEVNNPLMAIAAHAENRLADPTIPEEQRGEMTQILRQARRATKLLRGLLRFVRATEQEVTRVNLNDVVRGALDLVSYRFGVDEITVGGRLDPNLPPVQGDAVKLEQVVVNLLANAIDALRAIKPPRHLAVDTSVADGRASVVVADNGRGVAPEIAPRLFLPFATTKGRRGTGLGLYISRQIARDAGGELALVSPVGEGGGASFVLSLPLVEAAAEQLEPAAAAPAAPLAGPPRTGGSRAGLRVLIVDDEEAIRRPMARFLARRGARVEEAGDGEEALARLAGQPADVILADLRMPRMGGIELYGRLEDQHPALAARVMFLSGDVSQLAEPGNTPVPRERVLVKPVELAELERRIVEFVAGRGG